MRVYVIDPEEQRAYIEETEGGLDEWLRLLRCDMIDIREIVINGRPYDFICDDEALLKGSPIYPTVFNLNNGYPLICGPVAICRCDEGAEIGLEEKDIELIVRHIHTAHTPDYKRSWPVVGVEDHE